MSIQRKYFYSLEGNYLGHHSAILVNGVWCVEYTKFTLEQYLAENSDKQFSELLSWEDYEKVILDHNIRTYINPPAQLITEEKWWEMLGVLPPSRHHYYRGIEFFHLSEHITGNIVSWFARINNYHVELTHYTSASDEELVAKILETIPDL